MIKTRFAPSPTGYLHIGGLRTALYSWLFARKNGGSFVLRIEDTDRERLVDGACDLIYRTLKDTGLTYDEGPDVGGDFGPYIQSERKELYLQYALQLVEQGDAYYCFCDKDRLDSLRTEAQAEGRVAKYDKHCLSLSKEEIQQKLDAGESWVIRQNIRGEGACDYDDLVYGHISVPVSDMEDNILIKSDGWPTYNLANVVDDHLMGITHVIRGQEYLSSTPKYNLLYDAFGWQRPEYIHLPPVMKDKQRKLSKRYGDASYEDFINKGYLKEAIINYIALLGWSPEGEEEIFSLNELAEIFDTSRLNKSPAVFDVEKLTWMNGEYIRRMSPEAFLEKARPYIEQAIGTGFDTAKICALIQPRLELFSQIPDKVAFLAEMPDYDVALYNHKKMKSTPESSLPILKAAREALGAAEDFSGAALYPVLTNLAEKLGEKNGKVLWPVRIAVCGVSVTPGGATDVAELLGKDETLRRMDVSIEKLERALG